MSHLSAQRVVCWSDDEEWMTVFKQVETILPSLHSSSSASSSSSSSIDFPLLTDLINRLSIWNARSRLPVSISSTYAILRSFHSLVKGENRLLDHRESLSLALLRLVNGLCDAHQKGSHAQSIASLADRLGLPRLLVDIRHEATHQSMPSLDLLRYAASEALNWLFINYWKPTKEAHQQLRHTLLCHLHAYRRSMIKNSSSQSEALIIIRSISARLLSSGFHASLLIPLLVNESLIIKTPKERISPSPSRVSSVFSKLRHVWELAINFWMESDFIETTNSSDLPIHQAMLYQSTHFRSMLLSALIDRLVSSSILSDDWKEQWRQKLTQQWALAVLHHQINPNNQNKKRKRDDNEEGISNWLDQRTAVTLVERCLSSLNYLTLPIARALLPVYRMAVSNTVAERAAILLSADMDESSPIVPPPSSSSSSSSTWQPCPVGLLPSKKPTLDIRHLLIDDNGQSIAPVEQSTLSKKEITESEDEMDEIIEENLLRIVEEDN